jgi:hypothetical protein
VGVFDREAVGVVSVGFDVVDGDDFVVPDATTISEKSLTSHVGVGDDRVQRRRFPIEEESDALGEPDYVL